MRRQIKQFVFSGLLARHAVQDMEAVGLLHHANVTVTERGDGDLYASVQERIRTGSIEMQRVYRVLFVLENMVRGLISSRLQEADGADWFEKRAGAPMKRNVEKRREAEAKNQWHTGRNKEPIYYLDFGDLSKLLVTHWSEFEDLLPSQTWVQSRLEDAERSRNVIAHTNLLSSDEVSRLEMYLRDWIKQIG